MLSSLGTGEQKRVRLTVVRWLLGRVKEERLWPVSSTVRGARRVWEAVEQEYLVKATREGSWSVAYGERGCLPR